MYTVMQTGAFTSPGRASGSCVREPFWKTFATSGRPVITPYRDTHRSNLIAHSQWSLPYGLTKMVSRGSSKAAPPLTLGVLKSLYVSSVVSPLSEWLVSTGVL